MLEPDFASVLGPALASALEKKGFTSLTQVQKTVLDPAFVGRDLRITSQTGSGKTLAVGFALRDLVEAYRPPEERGHARPCAIVVAPTRELAKQVEAELAWLYAPLKAGIASVTGGASYRDELRALSRAPALVVGTPGRLLDHLNRGSINAEGARGVVLDEADRLLDLGFREELDAILAHTPSERRTYLVSATFPREVRALADKVQRDAVHVEGTRLGAANVDIDHVLHLVDPRDRVGAIINLMLAHPDEQTLIFSKTRAEVARIADELQQAGFAVSSLSGEMQQAERNRALAAFKRGDLRALVATDVAARGIDVVDISRVVHAEPPMDADDYTHRSGRTGRAGRKGISSVLISPSSVARTARILERAGLVHRFEAIPGAESIRKASEEQLFAELTADDVEGAEGAAVIDARTRALAERLATTDEAARTRTLARLLARVKRTGVAEPRDIRSIAPPSRPAPNVHPRSERPDRPLSPRGPRDRSPRESGGRDAGPQEGFAQFQVSWGEVHGADARRMLAVVCRRGGIRGNEVGAIRIGRTSSVVEIASHAAETFELESQKPDPRNPRIMIRREVAGASTRPAPEQAAPRAHRERPPTEAPRPGGWDRPRAPRAKPPSPNDEGPRPPQPRAHPPSRKSDWRQEAPRDKAPSLEKPRKKNGYPKRAIIHDAPVKPIEAAPAKPAEPKPRRRIVR